MADLDEAVADAEAKAEEAFDQGDVDWSNELEFHEFMSAFKNDASFVQKVAEAVKIDVAEISAMNDLDLEMLFDGLDKDMSGTISFQEFVDGIVQIRLSREQEINGPVTMGDLDEDAQLNEDEIEDAVADAEAKAEEAFDQGDVDWSDELEFHEFMSAFKNDPAFVQKVSEAAKIDVADINAMNDLDLEMLFDGLDKDMSGTISFQEFVDGLVQIRLSREQEIKE